MQETIGKLAAQRSKNFSYNSVNAGMKGIDQEERRAINETVLLGLVTQKGMFDTEFGKRVKAVNTSSSIEVSSESYETIS